jgi:hypothetical protein
MVFGEVACKVEHGVTRCGRRENRSAVDVNQPGLKGLLFASYTGSHGVWKPGR